MGCVQVKTIRSGSLNRQRPYTLNIEQEPIINAIKTNVLETKLYPISNDYRLFTNDSLGHGINGDVISCQHKLTKIKYALKVNFN